MLAISRKSSLPDPEKPAVPPKPRNLSFKKSPPKLKPKPAKLSSSSTLPKVPRDKRDSTKKREMSEDVNSNHKDEFESGDIMKPFPKRFQSKSVSYPFNNAAFHEYDK